LFLFLLEIIESIIFIEFIKIVYTVTLEGFFENLSLLSPASTLSDPQQLPPPDWGNGRPNGGVPPPKRGPKTGGNPPPEGSPKLGGGPNPPVGGPNT